MTDSEDPRYSEVGVLSQLITVIPNPTFFHIVTLDPFGRVFRGLWASGLGCSDFLLVLIRLEP